MATISLTHINDVSIQCDRVLINSNGTLYCISYEDNKILVRLPDAVEYSEQGTMKPGDWSLVTIQVSRYLTENNVPYTDSMIDNIVLLLTLGCGTKSVDDLINILSGGYGIPVKLLAKHYDMKYHVLLDCILEKGSLGYPKLLETFQETYNQPELY